MEAKVYLRQVRKIKVAIDGKAERMLQLRSLAESTTSQLTDMPCGGGEKDRLGAVVACIVDFTREIAEDTEKLVKKQAGVQQAINQIDDQDCRTLLELYYLNGYSWVEVAAKMGRSERQVYRQHGEALRKYAEN